MELDRREDQVEGMHRLGGAGSTGPVLDVLETGAAVRALWVPDRHGRPRNVVLGYRDVDTYATGDQYFGALIGRYANRLAGGRFSIDGTTYQVPTNNGDNALHGGPDGFHRRRWTVSAVDDSSITLTLTSPDGDQGFPGELRVTVRYSVTDQDVRIDYEAVTDGPTVVNLTNHAHFNLDGEDSANVDHHRLLVDADRFTPVDRTQIPTGELKPVDDTPFDLRSTVAIGPRLRDPDAQILLSLGIDHNFVINGEGLRRHAVLESGESGIRLEVLSDQPGVQIYTGNFFDGSVVGTGGRIYRQGAGIALETQNFPDAPNQPGFPSALLRPGTDYRTTTIWRFAEAPAA